MQFYTYLHRRSDTGEVFYVGKGHGRRAHAAGSKRSSHWNNVAKKHGRTVEIAAHWSTEEEAFQHEVLLIGIFRELGHRLVNLTDGGEGVSGFVPTEDQRKVTGQKAREMWSDADLRAKVLEAQAAARLAPGYSERMSAQARKHWSSPEARRICSEMSARLQADPVVRQMHSENTRRLMSDPAHAKKVSAGLKSAWSEPEKRTEWRAAIVAGLQAPECRKKISERSQQNWADPAYRARHAEAMRAAMAAPGMAQKLVDNFGGNGPGHNRRAVMCIDTGEVFESIVAAGSATGVNHHSVSANCRGIYKSAGGLHFKYVEEKQ